MDESIHEKLFALCKILHWLGKYDEMQAVSALAHALRGAGIDTFQKCQDRLRMAEEKVQ